MPTYEYLCTDCDNHWEEVQKISEPAIEVCPKCSKSTAKRQISGGNFILKGGGWYADLYSSTPKGGGASGEGASSSGSSTSSASGSGSSAPAAAAAPAKSESKAPSAAPPAGGTTK